MGEFGFEVGHVIDDSCFEFIGVGVEGSVDDSGVVDDSAFKDTLIPAGYLGKFEQKVEIGLEGRQFVYLH